jgi:chromosome transmission fidelity protein 1
MSELEENHLSIPNEFPFPYPNPYEIQLNFMKSLYKTLELKRIGIFESPTGTVKIITNKKYFFYGNL